MTRRKYFTVTSATREMSVESHQRCADPESFFWQVAICSLKFTIEKSFPGVLAQLVERLNGIEEVTGSNPVGSTAFLPWKGDEPQNFHDEFMAEKTESKALRKMTERGLSIHEGSSSRTGDGSSFICYARIEIYLS
jgi:hypothetical protein